MPDDVFDRLLEPRSSEAGNAADLPKAIRLVIIGRVQGVGFRTWLQDLALRMRIDGWVRNRQDLSVEAHAQAVPAVLDRLVELCRAGPPLARVDSVFVTPDGLDEIRSFSQRETV